LQTLPIFQKQQFQKYSNPYSSIKQFQEAKFQLKHLGQHQFQSKHLIQLQFL